MDHRIADWLDRMTREGAAENTIRAYARTMRTIPDAATATREDVEAWWDSRADRSIATRTAELACLRSFYRWCLTWEHRTDDPTLRIKAPRKPKDLPRPVSRADLLRILNHVGEGELRRTVCLGAYAGLRISEVAALHWADVDTEHRRLRVVGKGSKTRLVGLPPLLLDELLPDTGGNVVTGAPRGYTADTLQRKVNRAIKAAGVDATFHQLRHRYGTVALAHTGDLLAVSRALGHSSPATTAVYAATSDEMLDRIAEAVTR